MAKKLSLRPAAKTDEQQMAEFVAGANNTTASYTEAGAIKESDKPWNDPRVRDDVIKMVSLRLPEKYIMMLQYLSDKTHKSQQELLREVVIPWLEEEVDKY